MKSNYKLLGDIVRWCDERNRGEETSDVQGVSIGKEYMPSVANIIGTDLSNYKIVRVNRFACNPMHVGRDRVLPVALYTKETPAIVSPAYFTFEVINDQEVLPEYLMFFFRTPTFDKNCWFRTDGSVRGGISWDDMCRVELPVPDIDIQRKIITQRHTIALRIEFLQAKRIALRKAASAIFKDFAANCNTHTSTTFDTILMDSVGGDWGHEAQIGNYTEEVCCIRGADIPRLNDSSIADAPTRWILPKNYASKKVEAGDFIVEISGGSPVQSTGRIAQLSSYILQHYKRKFVCSNFCRVLKIDADYALYFLHCWQDLYAKGKMFEYENSSTGLKNFDLTTFMKTESIRLPGREEVKRFNSIMEPIIAAVQIIGLTIEKLSLFGNTAIRQILLNDPQTDFVR